LTTLFANCNNFNCALFYCPSKEAAMGISVVPACRQRQVTHFIGIPFFIFYDAIDYAIALFLGINKLPLIHNLT
jgi:hypothetical protein